MIELPADIFLDLLYSPDRTIAHRVRDENARPRSDPAGRTNCVRAFLNYNPQYRIARSADMKPVGDRQYETPHLFIRAEAQKFKLHIVGHISPPKWLLISHGGIREDFRAEKSSIKNFSLNSRFELPRSVGWDTCRSHFAPPLFVQGTFQIKKLQIFVDALFSPVSLYFVFDKKNVKEARCQNWTGVIFRMAIR
jgi:hypothetical protein